MPTIKDLIFDSKNANKGTPRGRGMLEKSLQKYGAGRSILIDKNNTIIAGNKTAECAGEIGLQNIRIIESDGSEIIAVKRTDIDINTKAGRELAIADNRVGQVDLDWDMNILGELKKEIDIDDFFMNNEILGTIGKEDEKGKDKKDMIKISVFYFDPKDWINWKNQIVNFLNQNKISYEIDE